MIKAYAYGSVVRKTEGDSAEVKNKEKADLNKDGKLSSYEKKRGIAIEKAMTKRS